MDLTETLKNYLDASGRLKVLPSRKKLRLPALAYLASKFEADTVYTEKQVNAIIEENHTFGDYFLLRRELVENKFLSRKPNGSAYWLEAKPPAPGMLDGL